MTDPRFDTLIEQVRSGAIDRRTFLVRSFALGISAAAAGSVLAKTVAAQDATPEASPAAGLTPENLGAEGVEHITGTDKGVINLYSSWPLSAASEKAGGDNAASVQLAVDIWGGEAGGFALTYEALDDGIAANNGAWDATVEANNATQVINDPDAVVYIGTYNSGAAEASIPIMNEAGMAMISPANTAVQLTKESPANPEGYPEVLYPTGVRNYMRVVPADDLQGGASANWAFNIFGAQSVHILHDNQTYGAGLANVFQATFEELGGEVLGFEAFAPDAPEYQALATTIANGAPDLIYISAIVNLNAAQLVQNLRELMPVDDVAIMGPDGLILQAFIDGAGGAAEGMYLTFGGLPPTELEGVGAEWYAAITEILGEEPDAYAAYSFDVAVCVLQAIDRIGVKDRAAMRDAMFATEGFRGMIGNWSFTETGDTTADTISLNIVQDGAITFQEVIGLAE